MQLRANKDRGIILLVVLSMLTFLGILVVTYVAFTSKSRRSAFAMASRDFRKLNHQRFIDDAVKTLVTGTANGGNAFYSEDLLSDLYGTTDSIQTTVKSPAALLVGTTPRPLARPMHVGGGFVRVPIVMNTATFGSSPVTSILGLDDILVGRVLTFANGPLAGIPFRILRSVGHRGVIGGVVDPDIDTRHSVYIELDESMAVTLDSGTQVKIYDLLYSAATPPVSLNQDVCALFYTRGSDGDWGPTGGGSSDYAEAGFPVDATSGPQTDDVPYRCVINSLPQNGGGVGFAGTNLTTPSPVPFADTGYSLPLAFQPNFVSSFRNNNPASGEAFSSKATLAGSGSPDESYDAADYQNWFLSHQYTDAAGNRQTIPSFHRPAVINHILNSYDLAAATTDELVTIVQAIQRATMRPLPFAANQFTYYDNAGTVTYTPPGTAATVHSDPGSNPRFTGGNTSFGLRTPIFIRNAGTALPTSRQRLHLLAQALINGPWDVDNDNDGVNDSVWVDLGLPVITSPEGKLLRPLVAPMIEDLSAKLNINAHDAQQPLLSGQASEPWAGTSTANTSVDVFRGIGIGPAEITLPSGATYDSSARVVDASGKLTLLNQRYSIVNRTAPTFGVAGVNNADALSLLINGTGPAPRGLPLANPTDYLGSQRPNSGHARSWDPWGRGGLGLDRTGQLVTPGTGTIVQRPDSTATPVQPALADSFNHPYELDPTGKLSGDQPFSDAEFDFLAQGNLWGDETLPSRLRDSLISTWTSSTVAPSGVRTKSELGRMLTNRSTSFDFPAGLPVQDDRTVSATSAFATLVDRLNLLAAPINATKLAAARAFIDSAVPRELRLNQKFDVNRPLGNGVDDNGNGTIDEPAEVAAETVAFGGTTSSSFPSNSTGTYLGGIAPSATVAIEPRELYARNLYILLMAISSPVDPTNPTAFPVVDSATADPDLHKARRIAQWAINVVDFRDKDAIMSRFAYDPTPLNGDGTWDTTAANVVWGVESPELIFSESLALHNLNVRNTSDESGGSGSRKGANTTDDDDTDSVRKPEGSLFLELYCPRRHMRVQANEPDVAGVPLELYDVFDPTADASTTNDADPSTYTLDLDRTVTTRFTAPTTYGTGATHEVPVWRIAISEPHYAGTTNESSAPLQGRLDLQDTYSFEPTDDTLTSAPAILDQLGSDTRTLDLQRFVFFTDYASPAALTTLIDAIPDIDHQSRVFFNKQASDAGLAGEQYLTIAPRGSTVLGSAVYPAGTVPTAASPQEIEVSTALASRGLIHRDLTGMITTPNTSTEIQPGLAIIAEGFVEQAWGAGATGNVGLNVSEPLARNAITYYQQPTDRYESSNADYPLVDAYYDKGSPVTTTNTARDTPEDMRLANSPIAELTNDISGGMPKDPMTGTVENYRTAFLQRLADPTAAFHPVDNPYRTVDQLTIDLTIYSGEELNSEISSAVSAPVTAPATESFSTLTRQRDGTTANGTETNVLFSYQTDFPNPASTLEQSSFYFAFPGSAPLTNTFNYLNTGFAANSTERISTGSYRGQPNTPFAMHHWLNRDYASAYELMLVPASSAGRLFEEFTAESEAAPNAYENTTGLIAEFQAPYRHLLNFFQSGENVTSIDDVSNLHRLFDFVGTTPRFRGEVEFVNPARLPLVATPMNTLQHSRQKMTNLFQAPYNTFWDNRRQGRLNLNTIGDYPVWMGLMDRHLTDVERSLSETAAGPYQSFLLSRRGYATAAGTQRDVTGTRPYNYAPASLHHDIATQFAGVFRTGVDGDLAPTITSPQDAAADDLRRFGVRGNLLRPGSTGTTGVATDTQDSVFVRSGAGGAHDSRDRSASMRYQTLTRMPNLVSEQSQTYRVRVTLGYFEVDPVNLWLGEEYNANIGQNKRHQATYVIDRSIPVGFAGPGNAINEDQVIVFSGQAE